MKSARLYEAVLHYAIWLAERLDEIFTELGDFDRVAIFDTPTSGDPAWIIPSSSDGKIYIVVAPKV